ncbi:MAG TPA: endo-1,4-beta-xylanase, partial [Isosphaeraceae bacterium]
MGVLKFRLNSPEPAGRVAELRKAYITGLDRTPERLSVEVRPGLLVCHRETPESGRLHVPWPVDGFGTPFVATATLAERAEPYDLGVELARGKLNDVRNQAADWAQVGLRLPGGLAEVLDRARKAFAGAATARDDPARAGALARECLVATFQAGRLLAGAYTEQVLRRRLDHSERLSTLLACGLAGDPRSAPWAGPLAEAVNAARVRCAWGELEPAEGQFRWDEMDAQLAWCRKNRLMPLAGPLVEFRAGALPDWLWLWEGDPEAISGMAVDLVRQVVTRYRGKVGCWHVVGRPASAEVLGLSEDEQIRLTA